MSGIYFTKDLFFASRVTAAARSLGRELQVVGSVEDLSNQAAKSECSLVLLDLDTPNLDPAAAVAAIRRREGTAPAVIAFGSHIHEDRLSAAQQAGCDRVLTRGQFDRQATDILRTHLT